MAKTIEQILEQFNNEYIMNPKPKEPLGIIPDSIDSGYLRFTEIKDQKILAHYTKTLAMVRPRFKFPSIYEKIHIIYKKI